jgi:hypothetical protein
MTRNVPARGSTREKILREGQDRGRGFTFGHSAAETVARKRSFCFT